MNYGNNAHGYGPGVHITPPHHPSNAYGMPTHANINPYGIPPHHVIQKDGYTMGGFVGGRPHYH